jgi:hypothetical protein
MRIYRGISAEIALEMTARLGKRELRAYVDEKTEGRYDPWELDKLTQWTEEHPAYRSLPELPDDQPQLPEISLES